MASATQNMTHGNGHTPTSSRGGADSVSSPTRASANMLGPTTSMTPRATADASRSGGANVSPRSQPGTLNTNGAAVNTPPTPTSASSSKPQSPTSDAPETIGVYSVDRTLGQGSYGKVKLGQHTRTGQKVALKILEKANIKTAKALKRVHREIGFLKLLCHPHIVGLLDVMETPDRIILVMEYASGGELFDYIVARRYLKEPEARRFFRQLLSAVEYCHRNSVIHRDLKPENLLLDADRNIRIIDFGFSNMFYADNTMKTYCGSPFYAAPEMILGNKYVGPEVDIWSMGIILFALLCGHLPFDDSNVKRLYDKIVRGHYMCPENLSPEAKHLLSRMIVTDRTMRATLDEVRMHPWVNEGCDGPPDNHLPLREDFTAPDEEIFQKLLKYEFDAETAKAYLLRAGINPIKATYYLLLEKRERERRAYIEAQAFAANSGALIAIDEEGEGGAQRSRAPMSPRTCQRILIEKQRQQQSAALAAKNAAASAQAASAAAARAALIEKMKMDRRRSQTIAGPQEASNRYQREAMTAMSQATAAYREKKERELRVQIGTSAGEIAIPVGPTTAWANNGQSINTTGVPMTPPASTQALQSASASASTSGGHVVRQPGVASQAQQPPQPERAFTLAAVPSQRRPSIGAVDANAVAQMRMEKDRELQLLREREGLGHASASSNSGNNLVAVTSVTSITSVVSRKESTGSDSGSTFLAVRPQSARRDSIGRDGGTPGQVSAQAAGSLRSPRPSTDGGSSGRNTPRSPKIAVPETPAGLQHPSAQQAAAAAAAAAALEGDGDLGEPSNARRRKRFLSLDGAMQSLLNAFGRRRESTVAGPDGKEAYVGPSGSVDGQRGSNLRTVRGLFNVSTTSSKPAMDIMKEVSRVLTEFKIEHSWRDYTVTCVDAVANPKGQPIRFEIEICKIPKLNLYGLHLKRLGGDTWPYKRLCHRLMSNMQL
eukprot:Opistho-2@57573